MAAQTVASYKSVQSLRPFDTERAAERLPDPQVSRRVCSAMSLQPTVWLRCTAVQREWRVSVGR